MPAGGCRGSTSRGCVLGIFSMSQVVNEREERRVLPQLGPGGQHVIHLLTSSEIPNGWLPLAGN
jgi:hypothetical protein